MTMTFALMIAAAFIVAMTFGITWAWRREIEAWNGGRCRCGGSWERFDTSSQGCRGYVCRACAAYIWLTYPRVEAKIVPYEPIGGIDRSRNDWWRNRDYDPGDGW